MLEEIKIVFYYSDECSIRVFEYRYKKIQYRYHDIKIYIDTIDVSIYHGSTRWTIRSYACIFLTWVKHATEVIYSTGVGCEAFELEVYSDSTQQGGVSCSFSTINSTFFISFSSIQSL